MGLFVISIENINGVIYNSNTTLYTCFVIFLTAIIMHISHIVQGKPYIYNYNTKIFRGKCWRIDNIFHNIYALRMMMNFDVINSKPRGPGPVSFFPKSEKFDAYECRYLTLAFVYGERIR